MEKDAVLTGPPPVGAGPVADVRASLAYLQDAGLRGLDG
jgi:hypothetical protein